MNRLREFFKKAWAGVQNAGNIPLLTGGMKFTALSHNPKDMDFKESIGGGGQGHRAGVRRAAAAHHHRCRHL
jgi:hypothetical protein